MPVQSGLLHRKCACGGTPGLDGQCVACRAQRLGVQTRLTISTPDDHYEQEADRVAEAVMRSEGTQALTRPVLNASITPVVQRQAEDEETMPEEETAEEAEGVEATEKRLEEMEESNVAPLVQRQPAGGCAPAPGGGSRAIQQALTQGQGGQGGSPLDPATRTFMEPRLGHDFSAVRVYADEQAHQAAQAIQARAFTVGQNIWFARGAFAPSTDQGRHLLAHELIHTLQQRHLAVAHTAMTIQRSICPTACEAPVSRGELCRSSRVTRDGCGTSDAQDDSNKISHIRVQLDRRKVHLFWNGAPNTDSGTKKEEIDCTPNADRTPRGSDVVGAKCGINHTSYARYNMAWFTAFDSTGMRVGFHDSQPLGKGFRSHGCVRVSCEDAEKINKNTKSGWTSIRVRDSLPTD
jgi:hypothetical protein